jgi:hypothetical protein
MTASALLVLAAVAQLPARPLPPPGMARPFPPPGMVLRAAPAPAEPQGPPRTPLFVYEEYDRIPDKLTMTLDLGPVVDEPPTSLKLKISCSFSGNARKPGVAPVAFVFDGSSRQPLYSSQRGLTLLADATRIGKTVNAQGRLSRGSVSEHLTTELSADEFRALAIAKTIEGKVGPTAFQLAEPQRAALAEFLDYIDHPSADANKRRLEAERLAELTQAAEAKKLADAQAAEMARQQAKTASDLETSEKLLQEARSLDRSSKTVKALETYRKIVALYPNTPAAKHAEARVKAMTKARR